MGANNDCAPHEQSKKELDNLFPKQKICSFKQKKYPGFEAGAKIHRGSAIGGGGRARLSVIYVFALRSNL
jgi:hypothetical protein